MNMLTDEDMDDFEADLEVAKIRDQLRAEYFVVDEYGVRRMVDPEYAKLFRTRLQAALDLQRSAQGLAPERAKFTAPRQPSDYERAAWERRHFAVDPKTGRRLIEDPEYWAGCDALRDRIFGTTRRDPSGRVMG